MTCKQCQSDFEPTHHKQLYCSACKVARIVSKPSRFAAHVRTTRPNESTGEYPCLMCARYGGSPISQCKLGELPCDMQEPKPSGWTPVKCPPDPIPTSTLGDDVPQVPIVVTSTPERDYDGQEFHEGTDPQ